VVKGAIVEFTVPVVLEDVFGVELIPEMEDTVSMGFGGIEVVLGTFEGIELIDRKVLRELFNREAGRILCCRLIMFYEIWGVYLVSRFPRVIAFGIALPFDEVLKAF